MQMPDARRTSRRRERVVAAVTMWLVMLSVAVSPISPPTAHAQPFGIQPIGTDTPGGSNPAGAVTLDWRSLGLPSGVTFGGVDANQDFNVPVPLGLTVTRLRGMVHPPVNLGPGTVEINDKQGTFLAAVDFPGSGPNIAAMPFDVDISAANVNGSTAGLSMTMRQFNRENQSCNPSTTQLRLSDLVTVYTGTEAPPTTIATFFPLMLQAVAIYAPVDSDKAEQQAVLALAAALTRLYWPQPVKITAVTQPRGATAPSAPQFTRAIVVERGPAGLQLTDPGAPDNFLRVSGRGDELSNQVSLLVNQLQALGQVPSLRITQAGLPGQLQNPVTFQQLNMVGRASVLGSGGLSVGVDRAVLGGRIDSVEVHLIANYTPIADAAATIMITSNNRLVYSTLLSRSGKLDVTFTLDRAALGQRVGLDLALTFTPGKPCEPSTPALLFQIDPESTMTLHRGGPPAAGFSAMPSEFSPNFLVGLDGSSPYQLGYATRVISDIARLTNAPLAPTVVDAKAAADSNLSALIVANGAMIKKTDLSPPVAGDGSAVTVDLPTQLRADLDKGLASIQAFADTPRNRTVVLVTTSDSWSLLNPLLDYIDGLPSGWSQLTGDVLAAGPAGLPVNLTVRTGAPVGPPPGSINLVLWIWVGAGAVLLIAGTLGVVWFVRRRRYALDELELD